MRKWDHMKELHNQSYYFGDPIILAKEDAASLRFDALQSTIFYKGKLCTTSQHRI